MKAQGFGARENPLVKFWEENDSGEKLLPLPLLLLEVVIASALANPNPPLEKELPYLPR